MTPFLANSWVQFMSTSIYAMHVEAGYNEIKCVCLLLASEGLSLRGDEQEF